MLEQNAGEDETSNLKASAKGFPRPHEEKTPLNYHGVYLCPVCRHGQISALPLMDALACNFCRHIFTADLERQVLQVVDGSQPLSWRWNGRTWKATHRQDDVDLTWEIWLVSGALVILPPILVWLAYHTFPPTPNQACLSLQLEQLGRLGLMCLGYWFPLIWTVLTFLCHFAFVSWLIVEHYQFPVYVMLRVQLQRWLERR